MRRHVGGFTLVEALATLTLVAIVLPTVMRGVSTFFSPTCTSVPGGAPILFARPLVGSAMYHPHLLLRPATR